ncbi:hypothetical protein ES332_A02G084400v1 [Gossypium tomentosum]|uniref:Isocitrate lyase n=1 Tax=Gossypium tomentosum TaxID=34277 RepID=A0A5D2REJ4_GOSTO|nr:hypothetical protein ES332_A02G084400v1 [Gossypium tomentosum]
MSTMTTIMLMPPKATSLQHSNFKPSTLRSRSSPTKSSYPTVRMQTRFHRLIEDQGIVLMPGCYDALSAAIVQQSGFTAGFISGYALSASVLGKPDFGLLTPPEMAATARTVCAAASMIPIIADADTGGGNALNVQRTVRDFIAAGAAGCFLEGICVASRQEQMLALWRHRGTMMSLMRSDAIQKVTEFVI